MPKLKRRLKGVNTSAAEQLFSWFRGYERSLNEMRPGRHRVAVLFFVRKHNALIDAGDTGHLLRHTPPPQRASETRGYGCSPKLAKNRAMGSGRGKRASLKKKARMHMAKKRKAVGGKKAKRKKVTKK